MKLDVYRSCTWREKREVLDAFWRTRPHDSAKIVGAALQYGPWAVLSLVIVAAELAVVVGVAADRGYALGWPAGAVLGFTLWSLGWATRRTRELKTLAR